ncbi:DUF5956 family protein [Arthrobacter sp. zg-Y769]|uniref:DUF5956 family protein n=1 Tax=Arthrobacter sp. zg-Y769 TaxID=2894191 RepID=UPI001E40D1DA|nr:DUF5956 family protein [Arthrobacter sp. zg-Y769]MCC9204099.1 DUF5956 family protein [Arthrobacter sp. zg-Y769]
MSTSGSWDEIPVLPQEQPVDGYTQLPFTGWFLTMGWAAGPEHTCRRLGTLNETLQSQEVLTAEDQEWIYELTNAYLAGAGIPPIPPGYVWFLARPTGISSDEAFWQRLNELINEVGGIPHFDGPAYITGAYPVIAEAVRRLYED